MSEVKQTPNQGLVKREPVAVEYIPFGAQDKIKMTISIIQNLIAVKTKTGQTCSDNDAMKFMAMCQAKRMNPFEGDCYLIGYDTRDGAKFSMVTAHQTYLKRAEVHPEFDGMKSGLIVREGDALKDIEGDFWDDGQEVVGGWATVFFKTRKQPMHKRLRLARFQKAFGVWQEDPAGMICKCAEADALRSSFPTMLGGLYMREEVASMVEKPEPVRPVFGQANQPAALADARPDPATQTTAPAAEPVPGDQATPEPARPPKNEPLAGAGASQPAGGAKGNPVLGLRNLCKLGKVKEGALLEYFAATAATDGAVESLEELQMRYPELVASACNNWPALSAKILSGDWTALPN